MWNVVGARDQYAIDTSKYTFLSFRLYTEHRTNYAVYWTGAKPVRWPTTDNYFAGRDGCYTGNNFIPWPAGWRIYFFDLTQVNGDPGAQNGAWQDQSLVRGLRIDPSIYAPANTLIQIDWIRLTNPNTSPVINIKWTTTGADNNDLVDIWVSSDAGGADAQSPLIRGIPALSGSYSFKTAILSPGQWYFKFYLMDGDLLYKGCGPSAIRAQTDWIGPLTIVQAPVIRILAPSMFSGPDYATTELGNPWDMSDSADVITPGPPYPQTLANSAFINGSFCATAVIIPPQNMSDAQIWLNVDPNRPINTQKYRYFTVKLKDMKYPADKDINWAIKNGWGARIVWWNDGIHIDGSETKYAYYYEDTGIYSVDLARGSPPPPLSDAPESQDNILTPREQNSYPAQRGWTEVQSVKYLRFDPMETTLSAIGTGADQFCIDWIKLTAQDQVVKGQPYAIRYTVTPTNPPALLNFYYTNDLRNPTQFVAQPYSPLIPSGPFRIYLPLVLRRFEDNFTMGGFTYLWDTSTVSPGTYYICIRATNAYNTKTYCSETPINVLSP
ncbi:MAG: hypothetical protein RMK30_10420 [Anaerolineae bacterium]|nr:hypothetical protein [Anaerolineae bacterium]